MDGKRTASPVLAVFLYLEGFYETYRFFSSLHGFGNRFCHI